MDVVVVVVVSSSSAGGESLFADERGKSKKKEKTMEGVAAAVCVTCAFLEWPFAFLLRVRLLVKEVRAESSGHTFFCDTKGEGKGGKGRADFLLLSFPFFSFLLLSFPFLFASQEDTPTLTMRRTFQRRSPAAVSRAAALALEACIAQHRRSLNSPFKAPHVDAWLSLLATQAVNNTSWRPPEGGREGHVELSLLPMETLALIGSEWKANARGFRITQIIDRCAPVERRYPPQGPREPNINNNNNNNNTARSTSLSRKETLLTLWSVQAALASLNDVRGPRPAPKDTLTVVEAEEALVTWLEQQLLPMLDFLLLKETEEDRDDGGFSYSSCLRVLHASLLYVRVSIALQSGTGWSKAFHLASQRLCEAARRGEGSDNGPFHARLHEKIVAATSASAGEDGEGEIPDEHRERGALTQGRRKPSLPEATARLVEHLADRGGRSRAGGATLQEPFHCAPPEQPLTEDMVERIHAQLSAIAEGGQPSSASH